MKEQRNIMEDLKDVYSLKFWVDPKQIERDSLDANIRHELRDNLSSIPSLDIRNENNFLVLHIEANLETIDDCHEKLKGYFTENKLNCIRVEDEVGDKTRLEAYPILAEIEQRFRNFVHQAILEVEDFNFNWWSEIAPLDIREKVEMIKAKSEGKSELLNPLECTQFDDLVAIIDTTYSKVSPDEGLSVTLLLDLIEGCNTVTSVVEKIRERIEEISYWDRFFSKYFQDASQWKKIKTAIRFVIRERHKVMHHRPMRYGVVQALKQKRDEIFAILDAAKVALSDAEKTEARQEIEGIQEEKAPYASEHDVFVKLSEEFLKKFSALPLGLQKRVTSKLNFIMSDRQTLYSGNFRKIRSSSEDNLYSYRISPELRAVCILDHQNNFDKPVLTFVDIFKHA